MATYWTTATDADGNPVVLHRRNGRTDVTLTGAQARAWVDRRIRNEKWSRLAQVLLRPLGLLAMPYVAYQDARQRAYVRGHGKGPDHT